MYIYVYIYVCAYLCVCVHALSTCLSISETASTAVALVYIYVYIHTHLLMYIHIYVHMYVHSLRVFRLQELPALAIALDRHLVLPIHQDSFQVCAHTHTRIVVCQFMNSTYQLHIKHISTTYQLIHTCQISSQVFPVQQKKIQVC